MTLCDTFCLHDVHSFVTARARLYSLRPTGGTGDVKENKAEATT